MRWVKPYLFSRELRVADAEDLDRGGQAELGDGLGLRHFFGSSKLAP
jgi:hypothetical protein